MRHCCINTRMCCTACTSPARCAISWLLLVYCVSRATCRSPAFAAAAALRVQHEDISPPSCLPQDGSIVRGEIFYFDYGCLAFWGLSERQEREVLGLLVREGAGITVMHRPNMLASWFGLCLQASWLQCCSVPRVHLPPACQVCARPSAGWAGASGCAAGERVGGGAVPGAAVGPGQGRLAAWAERLARGTCCSCSPAD